MDPNGAEFVHTVVEAMKLAYADREAYYGDPDFSEIPMEHLLSEAYNKERRALITAEAFVPAQNAFGGFVYGGGTMAFTAGYWALQALKPRVIAYLGCDMVYPSRGQTHFYGEGTADPLRDDITLQSLSAKAARLHLIAARQGCRMVNLSQGISRLVSPRADVDRLRDLAAAPAPPVPGPTEADRTEARMGYFVASGRYWEHSAQFDAEALRRLDGQWCQALRDYQRSAGSVLA